MTHKAIVAHVTELERDLAETKAAAAAAEAKAAAATTELGTIRNRDELTEKKETLQGAAVRTAVQSIIHDVAYGLVVSGVRDPTTGKVDETLPHPLELGEQPMELESTPGVFRMHPIWNGGYTHPTNVEFFEKVVKLVHERVVEDQRGWGTEEGGEAEKNLQMKRRARVDDLATDLRAVLGDFRSKYGEEATAGADEWLLAEFLPSEHSDCGEADPEAFKKYKQKMGGGCNGLEVRPKAWHGMKYRRFIGCLKSLRNARRKTLVNPKTGLKQSGMGQVRKVRFRGMKENINKRAPPRKKRMLPYASMVDPTWKADYEARENTTVPTADDPAHFTIASLDIPIEDLDEEERAYFGDSENDA
ncbi:hypothetical protein C8J57DRAFT_1222445 [Mycena rebaudengoi]|nr:hypothetical protein C8J57DRAFT_1222445 [Mycena rebaudengoi]